VANPTGAEQNIQPGDPQKQQPADYWSRFASALHPAGAESEPTVAAPPRPGLRKLLVVAVVVIFALAVVVIGAKIGFYDSAVAFVSTVQQTVQERILGSNPVVERDDDSAQQTKPKARHGKTAGQLASRGKGAGDSVPLFDAQGRPVPPFEVVVMDAHGQQVVQSRNAEIDVDIVQRPHATLNGPAGQPILLSSIRTSAPDVGAAAADGKTLTRTVTLRGVITQDGAIGSLRQVSGPPELLPAAIEVVRHAKFRPPTAEKLPAETQIAVHFTVDNK
jgi:Gram-negative bacterial TonB protein C-terminal